MIGRTKALQIRSLAREKLIERDAMRLPVDPIKVAKDIGIVVQSFEPEKPEISGFLMQSGNAFGIGYSKTIKSKGFQKFTVAHELGHYFIEGHPMALLKEGLHYSRSGFISKDPFEQEADIFGSEFLMPWKLIEKIVTQSNRGFTAIKSLADSCESSLVASAIRYAEVTRESVAIIVSHQGSIEFMTASSSFRQISGVDWLKRNDNLPLNVPSRQLCTDLQWLEAGSASEESSNLLNWFPSAPSAQVEEHIIGLGSYQRLLTVLVTDIDPDDDLTAESEDTNYIERWKSGFFRK